MRPPRRPVKTLAALPVLLASLLAVPVQLQAQKERAPGARLKPFTVYKHVSKGGLDYHYSVPKGYAKGACKRLVVICHGTGLDYRWGFANHAHKSFRPQDVVVSLSGPTAAQNGTRLFLGNKKDREAVRSFLAEMREAFGCTRVFLYGHSQGGFFVLDFAGAYPKEVAGVVAHASGAWASSASPKSLQKVPLAFLHGSSDPVVPYGQSVGSFEAYAARRMTVQLRRLEFYNHWPNELRAHEMISWCDGMTCETASEALDAVREMLRPKSADRYQWRAAPAFAAARQVLRRFEKGGDFASDSQALASAKKWIEAIEKSGAQHTAALAKAMGVKKGFVLSKADLTKGKPWLGGLLAVREDFRGVESVEEWLKEIAYAKAAKSHAKSADKILRLWYREKDEKKRFAGIMRLLPKAFVYDTYPFDMLSKLEDMSKRAKALGLKKRDAAAAKKFLERYKKSLYDGAKANAKVWQRFKLPKG